MVSRQGAMAIMQQQQQRAAAMAAALQGRDAI